ncbi:pirin family protein [Aliiglaciecola litoralis]|uniref:Pirin family protein n=1 Tax=Aliiglaciecola litoralis TaxID=582857 RepID=A0ABN1LED5_9ALTE
MDSQLNTRTIVKVVSASSTQDGAGVKLKRVIGQSALRHLDPFLMLDEFGADDPNDYLAGFPSHPHRGFQTVTYMLEGKMQHKDSEGNHGVIEKGGIQWMNAGKGIIHEEMPQHSDKPLHGFQLWVNLPASEKMSPPDYQDIQADQVPVIINANTEVKLLAGHYLGQTGPVSTQTVEPLFLDITFNDDDEITIPLPSEHNGFVYCYQQQVEISGQPFEKGQLAVLSNGQRVVIKGGSNAKCIVVAAAPLNEPIVQYGPFVMNTEAQIQQAIADFQAGRLTI